MNAKSNKCNHFYKCKNMMCEIIFIIKFLLMEMKLFVIKGKIIIAIKSAK